METSENKINPRLTPKGILIKEINEAIEQMKLIKSGKKKARSTEDFLNEL